MTKGRYECKFDILDTLDKYVEVATDALMYVL